MNSSCLSIETLNTDFGSPIVQTYAGMMRMS